MKDFDEEKVWFAQLVQARNFAQKDQHADAAARAGRVLGEVAAALVSEPDDARRARLQQLLVRVQREHAQHRARFETWRQAIDAGRQERMQQAPEEMRRPLPQPPPS
jgi:hypothetical protein